jgi:cyanophycinase
MLLGGNEWKQASDEADAWWLARASRAGVTVITSAAQDIPDTQVRWAAEHFRSLGATVEGCQIQTRRDAADPRLLAQLAESAAIYLCGGDPGSAQHALRDTPAASALLARYREGVPIAGSSAGAMVLGGVCLVPGQGFATRPGLGFFSAAVIPHWRGANRRWRETAQRLAQAGEVIAIDESTGACWDGASWVTRGPGRALVVTPRGERPVGEDGPSPPVE